MACVSACPDSAILATAQPESSLAAAIKAFAATQTDPTLAAETAKSHFVHTAKYGDVPAKRGIESADFGIFIDPYHCKGCAECVDVCLAQGHTALVMDEKIDNEPSGECTLDRYRRGVSFFRTLPTPPLRLRRRHRGSHGHGRHAAGPRRPEHGHRRRDGLQHRLRQHLSLQPVHG